MTSASEHAIGPGDLVDGRYRIVSLLGEGGMGAVFLAEHTGLSKEVALKVIHQSFAGDGEMRARFTREAMASARIDHPHVASALDIGTLPEGAAYLVMPLVRGPSLADVLDEGPMPWPRAVSIAAQIADALEAAHAAGIVHRDLKPDNVVLVPREDGRDHVKVLDFGIAGLSGEDPSLGRPLTRVGVVMGTPGYMSPEQAIGEPVDLRTDLYALGVILWEAIVGRQLFAGQITGIVTLQLTTVPPPASSLEGTVPPELDALIAKLLSRSRDERPARASEVRDALVALLPQMRQSLVDTLPTASESSQRVLLQSGAIGLAQTMIEPRMRDLLAARTRALLARAWAAYLTLSVRMRVGVVAVPLVILLAFIAWPSEEAADVAPIPVPVVVQTPAGPVIVQPQPPPTPTPTQAEDAQVQAPAPTARPSEGRLERAVRTLVDSEDRHDRQRAANTIAMATTTPVPEFARALARLELSRGCGERKEALEQIAQIGDVRALPYVVRLDALPRRGCGFLNARDCQQCIRHEIANTLRALNRAAQAPR